MTHGNAAAARVRLIVWCKDCQHQIEPDPAEVAARYSVETPVLDWREPARLFSLWQSEVDMVVTRTKRGG